MRYIFGNAISKIKMPPDQALKKRGIRWVRFLTGGKAEFHFVPPVKLKGDSQLRKIEEKKRNISPLESQFFENHAGVYVPDLTDIIIRCLKRDIQCHLNKREDGMYQFYIELDSALDYLDVDSIKVDFDKINKMYPGFRTFSFENNAKVQELLQKEYLINKAEIVNSKIYLDPLHDYAPRKLEVRDNGNIVIIGIDSVEGKLWKASGKMKDDNVILDFSCKGGPKNIRGKILKSGIQFEDGNMWNVL